MKFPDHSGDFTTPNITSSSPAATSQPSYTNSSSVVMGPAGPQGPPGPPGKQSTSNYPVVKHIDQPDTLVTGMYENMVEIKHINIVAKGNGNLYLRLSSGQEFVNPVKSNNTYALYQFNVEQLTLPDLDIPQLLYVFATPDVQPDVEETDNNQGDDEEVDILEEEEIQYAIDVALIQVVYL
jgi:hypothetical protein